MKENYYFICREMDEMRIIGAIDINDIPFENMRKDKNKKSKVQVSFVWNCLRKMLILSRMSHSLDKTISLVGCRSAQRILCGDKCAWISIHRWKESPLDRAVLVGNTTHIFSGFVRIYHSKHLDAMARTTSDRELQRQNHFDWNDSIPSRHHLLHSKIIQLKKSE